MAILALLAPIVCLYAGSTTTKNKGLRKDDAQRWADKEHLAVRTVHSIFLATGEKEGEFFIDNLDVHSLRFRRQILVSTLEPGTGHCLTAYIIVKQKDGFKPIWSADGAEEQNFCGVSLAGSSHAYVYNGRIIVQVPQGVHEEETTGSRSVQLSCSRFGWKSNTYQFEGSMIESVPAQQYKSAAPLCSFP